MSNINLAMTEGDFVVAIGASGCGKTTLLSCIAGFLPPTHGSIELDGKPVTGPGADRGVVFQKHALMPWLDVGQNVEFGLRMRGVARGRAAERRDGAIAAGRARRVRRAADLRALRRHAAARGHRPRARFGSAIDADGRAVPGALDAFTRESIQELILDVWHGTGKMCFFITHSVEEALFLATHLVVMTPSPGRISHEYDLDFGRRLETRDARAVKSDPEFIRVREEVLSVILHRDAAAPAASARPVSGQ